MKLCRISALLCLLMAMPCSLPGGNDLPERLQGVLKLIQERLPKLMDNMSAAERDRLLGDFARSFNCGIEYIPTSAKASATADAPAKSYPCIRLRNAKLLYKRLDAVSSGLELGDTTGSELLGIILDLRECRDGDHSASLAALDHITSLRRRSSAKPLLIAALISRNTAGSAESMAAGIKSRGLGVVMGENSAGIPFKPGLIALPDGGSLSIPSFPPDTQCFRVQPLEPMVPAPPFPQATFDRIRDGKIPSDDECLRRAADLLVSLDAVRFKLRQ